MKLLFLTIESFLDNILSIIKTVVADDALPKGTDSTGLPTVSATDSDMDSGSLRVDEGEKKKHLKRKPLTSASNTPVSNAYFLFYFRQ